jgi:hypothetical protein
MPNTPISLKTQERLFRRLRREPAIKLLTAQIGGADRPLKIFTTTRTIVIWSGGDLEQWFGTLGGHDRSDPHMATATFRRSHTKSLTIAADYRRWGRYQTARDLVAQARDDRLNKHWRALP